MMACARRATCVVVETGIRFSTGGLLPRRNQNVDPPGLSATDDVRWGGEEGGSGGMGEE